MIRYDMSCGAGHRFDSWFRSSDACDSQLSSQAVECPVCGATDVSKALMAPAVTSANTDEASMFAKLQAFRREVLDNAEYVGDRFAQEVRDMEADPDLQRQVYGEATREEVRELLEDGISVCPVPPPSGAIN